MKLFPAKCHERATLRKLWRQTGNSSLLPLKCWPLLHFIYQQRDNGLTNLLCYITNHLMIGPLGNSEFCLPRISMFPEGNKIHCSPRDHSFNWYVNTHGGFEHVRVRCCTPPPHVLVQDEKFDHSLHLPSIWGRPLSTHSPLMHHYVNLNTSV